MSKSAFFRQKDTPLTAQGPGQVQAVGEILLAELSAAARPRFRLASPLRRAALPWKSCGTSWACRRTASPPMRGCRKSIWDFGTSSPTTQARARDPGVFACPRRRQMECAGAGRGNYEDVAARASDWVAGLTADTFAVSHGAITRILRGLFAGPTWQAMSSAGRDPGRGRYRVRGNQLVRLDP